MLNERSLKRLYLWEEGEDRGNGLTFEAYTDGKNPGGEEDVVLTLESDDQRLRFVFNKEEARELAKFISGVAR